MQTAGFELAISAVPARLDLITHVANSKILRVTIVTLSSFDHYVSWSQKAQLQVRRLVSYSIIYTVRVHVRVISTNS